MHSDTWTILLIFGGNMAMIVYNVSFMGLEYIGTKWENVSNF